MTDIYQHGGWGQPIPGTFHREWVRNTPPVDPAPLSGADAEWEAAWVARLDRERAASPLTGIPRDVLRDPVTQGRVPIGAASTIANRYVLIAESHDGQRAEIDGEPHTYAADALDAARRDDDPFTRHVRVYDTRTDQFITEEAA